MENELFDSLSVYITNLKGFELKNNNNKKNLKKMALMPFRSLHNFFSFTYFVKI